MQKIGAGREAPPRPRHRTPAGGSLAAALALPASPGPAPAQLPTGVAFTPVFATDGANKLTWPTAMEEIPGEPGTFPVLEKNSGTDPLKARIRRKYTGILCRLTHAELPAAEPPASLAPGHSAAPRHPAPGEISHPAS